MVSHLHHLVPHLRTRPTHSLYACYVRLKVQASSLVVLASDKHQQQPLKTVRGSVGVTEAKCTAARIMCSLKGPSTGHSLRPIMVMTNPSDTFHQTTRIV